MITIKELTLFKDYIDDDMVIGIGIPEDQVLCTLVFYIPNTNNVELIHEIQVATRLVTVFNKRCIDMDIDCFFSKLKNWEHLYCTQIPNDHHITYSFMEYIDDQFKRYVNERDNH